MSPFVQSENLLSIPREPPSSRTAGWDESYDKIVELRAALLAAVNHAEQ
jgi:hypothetical protein